MEARLNYSCSHEIVPFATEFMGKCKVSSMWLAVGEDGKLSDFFTPDFNLGSSQLIGEVLVTNV